MEHVEVLISLLPDATGWLLIPVTFAVLLLSPQCRARDSVMLASCFAVALHHVVVIIHSYFFFVPGAEGDAARFHFTAAAGDVDAVDYHNQPYVRVLTSLYWLFGRSLMFGCELSVLAFAFSIVILLKICDWLEVQQTPAVIVLYGCLPGFLFHTSVTLRESFQALTVLTVVLLGTILLRQPRTLPAYFALACCGFLLSRLHNQLHYLAIGLCGLAFVWFFRRNVLIVTLAILLAGPAAYFGASKAQEEETRDAATSASAQILTRMESYRLGVATARAHYGGRLDVSSPAAFVTSFPPVFFLYMFAPLPWQVSGLKDLYALAESMLRMALLVGALYTFVRSAPDKRERHGLILLMALSIESFWSIGTINWGQAIRHRTLAWGLLVAVGLPAYLRRKNRSRFGVNLDNQPTS